MKRSTDSPMFRGGFDILQRRRRIKFPGEFPITLTNVGRLSAQNWIMKTEDRLYECGDLRANPVRFSRNEYRKNAHTLEGKIPSIHEATTAARDIFKF